MQTPAAAWPHSLVAPAVWLTAHGDKLYVGHFANSQGAVALGSSQGRKHTAKGLMTIHSATQRQTDVKQHLRMLATRMETASGMTREDNRCGCTADRPTLGNCRANTC